MSRIYILLLAFTGMLISSVGAFFSMVGLTHLFSGAPLGVGVMAGSLELAKLVVAGFLFRYWGHVPRLMRGYLSSAVVILSLITSLGVFGFLSHAYQKSTQTMKTQELKITQLKAHDTAVHERIGEIEQFIRQVPVTHITRKAILYKDSRSLVAKLQAESESIRGEIRKLELEHLDSRSEIGPLMDVSQAFGIPVDTVAKILILLFVSVFDPLAICIVFAWGLAIRLREKYRGNEARISRHGFGKPVDHRFKKFSFKKVA